MFRQINFYSPTKKITYEDKHLISLPTWSELDVSVYPGRVLALVLKIQEEICLDLTNLEILCKFAWNWVQDTGLSN